MGQVIAAILLIVAIAVAFKVAIILLVLAGLIFRTKETIALLSVLAIIALLSRYPLIGMAVVAIAIAVVIFKGVTRSRDGAPPCPPMQPKTDLSFTHPAPASPLGLFLCLESKS